MPPAERPDIMALYPSWWGVLPLWFGQVIGEVPVSGNVICGGAAKVLYRPDWSPLEGSGRPFSLADGRRPPTSSTWPTWSANASTPTTTSFGTPMSR